MPTPANALKERPEMEGLVRNQGDPGSDEYDTSTPNPDPGSKTPAAQSQGVEEDDKNAQIRAQGLIDMLQLALVATRQKWIMWRKTIGVEDRWRSDLDVYYGKNDPMDEGDYQPKWPMERREPVMLGQQAVRSMVRINITAAKTDAAVAKVQEILFPTDDKNWALDPEGADSYEEFSEDDRPVVDDSTGQQIGTVAQAALIELQKIRKAAAGLSKDIEEALEECDYGAQGRDVIEWGGMLGTGILKGPITRLRRDSSASMQGAEMVRQVTETEVPASESIDPRNFWPDPDCGADIRQASGCFERRMISASELRSLAEEPNYLPDRIRQVLSEKPKKAVSDPLPGEENSMIQANRPGMNYELWEYHGEIETEVLEAIMGAENVDPLDGLKVCVIIVNDHVVGAYQYTVEGDLSYDVFNWKKDKECIFGYGIPWLYRTQQRVINAAWRAAMDNMGAASGAQIVMLEGSVEGADGNNEIRGRKVWLASDTDDVEKAFKVWDIPSKLDDMIKLIDKANDLGDKETNVPDLLQGIKGSAPDQVGSLISLLSNSEGVLRRVVKQYDDQVTKRHLPRYVRYFREHGKDETAKTPVKVVARGADVLFTRAMKTALLFALAKMKESSPVFGPHLREREILVELMKSGYIDPSTVLNTPQEVKQHQQANPPQPPPEIEVANTRAKADIQKTQLQLQRQQEIEQGAADRAQQQHQQRMQEMEISLQIEIAKLAQQERLQVADIRAMLAGKIIDANVKHQLQANAAEATSAQAQIPGE